MVEWIVVSFALTGFSATSDMFCLYRYFVVM